MTMMNENNLGEKLRAAENEIKRLKAELRVAVLAKALDCDQAKAADMAPKLAGLTDREFYDHSAYMAEKLAELKKDAAEGRLVRRPQQVTDLPAPALETPKKLAELRPGLEAERVQAAVSRYMSAVFATEGDDSDVEDVDLQDS
jgi:hypothetical protein